MSFAYGMAPFYAQISMERRETEEPFSLFQQAGFFCDVNVELFLLPFALQEQ